MEHQQKLRHSDLAFVLGNGTSRSKINLQELKTQGAVFGCNALYREFAPDYLIAVDVKMVNEIIASGYHAEHEVWTNPNKGISSKNRINLFSPHKGWSSGPTALWFACQKGYKSIYIAGFDYQGINGKFNNVYADTFNYKRSGDTATFFGNWLSQTEKTIREHPNIKFYRVIEFGGFVPDKLQNLRNLQHITYDDLQQKFRNCIYSDEILQKTTI
jgi:hypothetical protein